MREQLAETVEQIFADLCPPAVVRAAEGLGTEGCPTSWGSGLPVMQSVAESLDCLR